MACADVAERKLWVAAQKEGVAVRRSVPRILLADDQEEVRRTVAGMLEDEFQIVGLAENGKEVLDLVFRCSPNVLVLDIFMPVLNGIETAQQVKSSGSRTEMVILTVHKDPDFFRAAISAGVLGYVLKPHITTDLIPAIRAALHGQFYVSPSLHYW